MSIEVSEVYGVKVLSAEPSCKAESSAGPTSTSSATCSLTAVPKASDKIVEAVSKVREALITHYHEDHVGAAPLLNAEKYAPDMSVSTLKRPSDIPAYN